MKKRKTSWLKQKAKSIGLISSKGMTKAEKNRVRASGSPNWVVDVIPKKISRRSSSIGKIGGASECVSIDRDSDAFKEIAKRYEA